MKVSYPKKSSGNLIQVQSSTFATVYDFYEISLSGIPVIVARRTSPEGMNGSNVAKEFRAMKEYFPFLILLELSISDAVFRRQLIGRKVNFVVSGQQLYFPELYISLTETKATRQSSAKMLTISAQVLLLYHLQKRSLAGISFKEIAGQIGYSTKTVSLVVAELCYFGIARVVNVEHHKTLQFYKRGAELYLQVDKWLQSPVMASGYTDCDIETPETVKFGNTTIISSKRAKEIKLKLYATPQKHCVEVWKYDPVILTTNAIADPLSTLLSKITVGYGTPNRYYYNDAKPSVLEQIKWADKT